MDFSFSDEQSMLRAAGPRRLLRTLGGAARS